MNDPEKALVLFAPGERDAAEALGGLLGTHRSRELEPGGASGASRVAAALVAAERVIADEGPGAVILVGPGPEAGAAALAAVKLGVPVVRVSRASPGEEHDPAVLANLDGAVAERLAGLVVPGGDDPRRAADAIRAWLATYTSSP